MNKVLNNPYHLQKQRENLKVNSQRQSMSPDQLIAKAQMIKLSSSEKKKKTRR
jgi:hypothetical protein